jgi:hypothetical protein
VNLGNFPEGFEGLSWETLGEANGKFPHIGQNFMRNFEISNFPPGFLMVKSLFFDG